MLPVQPSLERDQIDIIGLDTVYYQEHVVEPAGEASSDMDILAGLAEKMGLQIGEENPIHSNEEFMNKVIKIITDKLEEVGFNIVSQY